MKIVLIYSPLCRSKIVCISFFWQTPNILKNVGNQTIDFHCDTEDISQNVIFYVYRRKKWIFIFGWTIPTNFVVWGIAYNHTSSIFNTGAITISCIGNSLVNKLFWLISPRIFSIATVTHKIHTTSTSFLICTKFTVDRFIFLQV